MKRVVHPIIKYSTLLFVAFLLACGEVKNVKIGVIIPSEGSLGDYGFQIISGIELAEKAIREDKETFKRNYEIILQPESADPGQIDVAINSFNNLKKQKVRAVIGAASSAATLAIAPLANESQIILMSPASSSPEISTEGGDFVFRNYPSDTLEAQFLSHALFQKCKFSNVLVVRSKSAYAEGISYEFLNFARKVVSQHLPNKVVKFASDVNEVDFATVVDEIVEINPQGVFLGAYTDALIPLIKEIRTREELKDTYIFTSSSFLPDKVVKAIGPEAMDKLIYTAYTWSASSKGKEEFIQQFESTYHTPPNFYAAAGYDALMILAQAMEESNPRIPNEVKLQLRKHAYTGVLGETSFNKRGDVTRVPQLLWMKDGQPVPFTDEDMEEIKRWLLTR